MPLEYEGKYLLGKSQSEWGSRLGVTRLLLRRNEDGTFKPVIMRIFADSTYLSKNGNQFDYNTFKNQESDFTGEILFYDWEENYLGANRYQNGQITHYSQATTNKSQIYCIEIPISYWATDDSQLGDMGSTRTISGGYWATTIQLYCWVEIAGGGGSGGSGPSGGGHANGFDPYCIDCGDGGDTGGGGVGLLSNIDPELQAITDPNNPGNLFTEDWAKLSQALKQGIANDPVLKKAYDYLVNKQIKTSWQGNSDPRVGYMFTNIDTNGNITVYINPILFRDDQKAKLGISLFEEILHMDQYAYYGETDYATKSPSNMEFEAKFILEYLNKVKNNSLFPNTNTGLYETGAQYNTFNDWLKTLTPAQLTAVGFIKDAYFQYAEKFRAGYAAIAPNHVYAAPLDPNFLPLLLFFFLNN